MGTYPKLEIVIGSKHESILLICIIESSRIILELCSKLYIIFLYVEILVYRISCHQFFWKRINHIYGMSQVIWVIRADKGIESFISILLVVPYDELLSITVLGGYFSVTKIGVNLVFPLRYNCRIFQEGHVWLCSFHFQNLMIFE